MSDFHLNQTVDMFGALNFFGLDLHGTEDLIYIKNSLHVTYEMQFVLMYKQMVPYQICCSDKDESTFPLLF